MTHAGRKPIKTLTGILFLIGAALLMVWLGRVADRIAARWGEAAALLFLLGMGAVMVTIMLLV